MLFSSLDLEYGADSPWHGIWVFITGVFIYGLKTVLRNYFKTALRNLLRHPGYSFINIGRSHGWPHVLPPNLSVRGFRVQL